jgi:hypothetical protein
MKGIPAASEANQILKLNERVSPWRHISRVRKPIDELRQSSIIRPLVRD